jgi:hypothetical protein
MKKFNLSQIMKTAQLIRKQNGLTLGVALKKSWAIAKEIVSQVEVIRTETHEATANQIRKLAEYGVNVSCLKGSKKWTAGYNQVKVILETLGWFVENRKLVFWGELEEIEYVETLAEAYGF